MAKLFSTPIACGLVTGAAAGGVFTWWMWRAAKSQESNLGADLLLDYATMVLMCSGPALCRRNSALIPSVLVWAAFATVVDISIEFCQVLSIRLPFLLTTPLAFIFTSAGSGAIIGAGLWMMYGSRVRLRGPLVLGMLGQLILFGILYAEEASEGNVTHPELWTMPLLLAYVAATTAPVIGIDREMREHVAKS